MSQLNTIETLLEIRKRLAEVAEHDEEILELRLKLAKAMEARSSAADAVRETLEGFVEYQSRVHGFTNTLDELLEQTKVRPKKAETSEDEPAEKKPRARKKKKAKKKARAKRKTTTTAVRRSSETGRVMPKRRQSATGYPGLIDTSIHLSDNDREFLDVLVERYPLFTTPQFFIRKGISSARNVVTAKVSHLRKRGLKIESARDARKVDPSVTEKDKGYRLIDPNR